MRYSTNRLKVTLNSLNKLEFCCETEKINVHGLFIIMSMKDVEMW